jgi:hypothetical protein
MYRLWHDVMAYEEIEPVSLEELHAINEDFRMNGSELPETYDVEEAQRQTTNAHRRDYAECPGQMGND